MSSPNISSLPEGPRFLKKLEAAHRPSVASSGFCSPRQPNAGTEYPGAVVQGPGLSWLRALGLQSSGSEVPSTMVFLECIDSKT